MFDGESACLLGPCEKGTDGFLSLSLFYFSCYFNIELDECF